MNQEQTMQDILEIVQFMQGHMATKDDISELRTEMKSLHSEMIGHVDAFVGLHQKLDIELTSLRAMYT